jgi:hypothetical protein
VRWSQAYGRKWPPPIEAIASGTAPGLSEYIAMTTGSATTWDIAIWMASGRSGLSIDIGRPLIVRSSQNAIGSATVP